MTQGSESVVVPREAQDRRRTALIERLGTIADLACTTPLPGELGDVAYDLLRQAAAQIASDRLHIRRLLAAAPSTSVRDDHVPDAGKLIDHSAAIKHLRDRARGFRQAAFVQGKRAGPLAMGFEAAADDLAALVPSIDEGKRHG
jgi:hypothetical protein